MIDPMYHDLRRLAEAAEKFQLVEEEFRGYQFKVNHLKWRKAQTTFQAQIGPTTIVALIARLREAEDLVRAAFVNTRHPTTAQAEWLERARVHLEKHRIK